LDKHRYLPTLRYAIELSPSGVRSIWLRENMNTMALRINKSKPSQISC
jgi:hypothetical protein